MPAQTQIAQPPDIVDTFTAKGDTVITHDPETARGYRAAAEQAAQRGPGRVIPSKQPAAPSEVPLPMSGVANAVVGKHLQRLRVQAEAGRRDLQSRFVFGANGMQLSDPGVLAMRAELVAGIEAAEEEIRRIEALDDPGVRDLAFTLGAR